jgi:serine/threonine protein kinase
LELRQTIKEMLPIESLGPYEGLEEIGRGATARVLLGRHQTTGVKVCLKVFHEGLLRDPRSRQRVLSEIELSQSLSHPNIVPIVEVLEKDPPVLVMQYVDGQNLEVFQSRLPYVLPEVSALIVREIAKGLQHAHSRNIIHRDLKPENVLVSTTGNVFITDFGLAKQIDTASLTEVNAIVGSLHYLSPEQVRGDRVGAATDIFSLGAIFYFLTTGTRPFLRSTLPATLTAIREQAPQPAREQNPKVSIELNRIIEKALAKDPANRFADAKQFETAITTYLEGLGLTEDRFNLPVWIASSQSETMEALRVAASQLEQRCEDLFSRKNKKALLEGLSHLSLKAPGSAVLARLSVGSAAIRSASSLRKRYTTAAIAGVVVSLGLAYYFSKSRTEAPVADSTSGLDVASQASGVAETAPARANRRAAPVKPAKKTGPGTVIFKMPRDAEVFWDFERVYNGAVLRDQAEGRHSLIVNRPGHDLERSEIMVKGDEPVRVNIHE